MQTLATTYCTNCGYLYYGADRKSAIRANIRHGQQPQNAEHTIVTEIRKTTDTEHTQPLTIISGNN